MPRLEFTDSQKLKCDFCSLEVLMLEGETKVSHKGNDATLSIQGPKRSWEKRKKSLGKGLRKKKWRRSNARTSKRQIYREKVLTNWKVCKDRPV